MGSPSFGLSIFYLCIMKHILFSLFLSVFWFSSAVAQTQLADDQKIRQLIFQDIKKQGVDQDPATLAAAQAAYDAILIRAWGQRILSKLSVTPDLKASIYNELSTTIGDKEYRIIHIFVAEEKSAQLVIQGLKETKDWPSFDPKKFIGETTPFRINRTDWINLTAVLPEFRTPLKALKAGEYTISPIRGHDGFHVVALVETRPFKLPAMESLRDELNAIAERKILDQYIQSLSKSTNGK